jgi:D-3-phosphoglycerate dehydrogenase / 2-oxoglutarate reductase
LGLLDLGAIGKLLAKSCLALGMNVMVAEKFIDHMDVSEFKNSIHFMKDAREMYPSCDFISINVPLLSDTKGMINKESMSLMKDGVIILNFARDTLVNDQDMEDALLSKKVRRYVTDFPNFKTANMQGVLAIPHLGASTEEAEDNCALMAVDQIRKYIENGSIINSVNYPNLIVSKEIAHTRLKILFNCLENTCNQSVQAILDLAKNYTFFQKETRNLIGYMIIDFDHEIDDHMIEKMMNLDYVIRVIKIRKG